MDYNANNSVLKGLLLVNKKAVFVGFMLAFVGLLLGGCDANEEVASVHGITAENDDKNAAIGYEEDVRQIGITAGNSINGGLAAMCEERIYFANPQSRWRMYSMNHDGSDMVRLNDIPSANINVVDGVIYYVLGSGSSEHEWQEYAGTILKMNTDGSRKQQVFSAERIFFGEQRGHEPGFITELVVIGNQIFYNLYLPNASGVEGSGLFVVQTDGTNNRKLTPYDRIVRNINISDGYIYFQYITGGMLYEELFKMNLDGTSIHTIGESLPDYIISSMLVYGEEIYLIASRWPVIQFLYSLNRKTGDFQQHTDFGLWRKNISNNIVFFITFDLSANFHLYRMNLYGTERQRLSDYAGENIIILGEEIFFFAQETPNTFSEMMLFRMNLDGSNKRRVV